MALSSIGMAQLVRNYIGYLRLEDDFTVTTWDSSWQDSVRYDMGSRGWESACAGMAGCGKVGWLWEKVCPAMGALSD